MPDIKLENVIVVYEENKKYIYAINDISATFKSNQISVILGYSGCGKTTLLKAVAGLLNYNGSITIDGVENDELLIKDKNIAYVSQNYVLYPHMTIFENIAFPLTNMDAPKQEIIDRVTEIAEILDLTHCLTRKPKHLSGGQQQRVALARALVKRPEICLFDEPLSNIDEQFRREARQMIKQTLKKMSCTAIYVTHSVVEAMSLADELFVLNEGKLEISGVPIEVYNYGNSVMNSLIGGDSYEFLSE